MLQPKTDWYWYVEQQKLFACLGDDLHFETAYDSKHLINLPLGKSLFDLQDTERYYSLAEILGQGKMDASPGIKTQILLNATAALKYHKPVAPKSWFFKEHSSFGFNASLGILETINEQGLVLRIINEFGLHTCMLLSKPLQLSANKTLQSFGLIKVAENRIRPYMTHSNMQKIA